MIRESYINDRGVGSEEGLTLFGLPLLFLTRRL